MEDIITFIKDNYWWLIVIISGVIEFILLLLLKRHPQLLDPGAYNECAVLIKAAENKFGSGHGKEKLQWVLEKFFNGKVPSKDIAAPIIEVVEFLLTLPKKKV